MAQVLTFGFGPIASTTEYQNMLSKVVVLVLVSGVGFVGRGYSSFGSGWVIMVWELVVGCGSRKD